MTSDLLLLIPPLTQLNTPYPSTAYLTGFLRSRDYRVFQADIGIEMVLSLFCRSGLFRVFEEIRPMRAGLPGAARQILALEGAYLETIDAVIGFLQGTDGALASRICRRGFLPEGPRFNDHDDLSRTCSMIDRARHLATLYLEDLADLIRETVAPQFALSRYAEQVGVSTASFDQVLHALSRPPTITDELMLDAVRAHVDAVDPAMVGMTVPFPGNLYGAFRIAAFLKAGWPSIKIVLGGGYANTELRRLRDTRVFDYVDYVTLDDGERPLLCLLEHLAGKREPAELRRTFLRSRDSVVFCDGCRDPEFGMAEVGTPTYVGLPLHRYLSVLDTLNPMHRLWSEGHWNKLTVAHGCYWKQCTFCDVGLDYIGRYEAAPGDVTADRIEALIAETGRRGFHFVDEAAPPAALKALAVTLLERGLTISWWSNIRFETAFTPDLCRLLAASGCIAVSAGLEAASDRLLDLMKKGITVNQTAQVAAAFRAANILVHAYLMYGFPSESVAETIDSLERVRQLFAADLLQSAFWHRFAATAHSPIGLAPSEHGIRILGPVFGGFAENDLVHEDDSGGTPEWLGEGLRAALFNYKEGRGLTADVRSWFPHPVPKPRVAKNWMRRVLEDIQDVHGRGLLLVGSAVDLHSVLERRLIWIGGEPVIEAGRRRDRVILPNRVGDAELRCDRKKAEWLLDLIWRATPARHTRGDYPVLKDIRCRYPMGGPQGFERLVRSRAWGKIRETGLLVV